MSVAKGDGHILRAYNNSYPVGRRRRRDRPRVARTRTPPTTLPGAMSGAYGELRSTPAGPPGLHPEGAGLPPELAGRSGPDRPGRGLAGARRRADRRGRGTARHPASSASRPPRTPSPPSERIARYTGPLADRGVAFAARAKARPRPRRADAAAGRQPRQRHRRGLRSRSAHDVAEQQPAGRLGGGRCSPPPTSPARCWTSPTTAPSTR